jgi:hypothetical protein
MLGVERTTTSATGLLGLVCLLDECIHMAKIKTIALFS